MVKNVFFVPWSLPNEGELYTFVCIEIDFIRVLGVSVHLSTLDLFHRFMVQMGMGGWLNLVFAIHNGWRTCAP